MFIVHKLNLWSNYLDTKFTLLNYLFGGVKLSENADPDKFSYSDYDLGFHKRGAFSLSDGSECIKNVIIFGFDNNSSV